MAPHLRLVLAGSHLGDDDEPTAEVEETNLVDLDSERLRRRYRYHPSAGGQWIDDLFDDDLDPVC